MNANLYDLIFQRSAAGGPAIADASGAVTLDYPTLPTWGNVGSVSLPLSLALAADAGALAPGDTLALLGIGSGLNCVMLGATWA